MAPHHGNTELEDEWIASDGWAVLAIAGILTIILALISLPVGTFALGMMLWLRHTLRAPRRVSPEAPGLVLAPADGVVIEVAENLDDAGTGPDLTGARRVTIRTGLAGAQLQRSPVAGHVIDNFLIPGLFRGGEELALMRRDNERREISIETEDGTRVMLVQIGTATARQLVCRFAPGKYLAAGAPLGMARMGGITDLIVPPGYEIVPAVGMSVLAGETILAERGG